MAKVRRGRMVESCILDEDGLLVGMCWSGRFGCEADC